MNLGTNFGGAAQHRLSEKVLPVTATKAPISSRNAKSNLRGSFVSNGKTTNPAVVKSTSSLLPYNMIQDGYQDHLSSGGRGSKKVVKRGSVKESGAASSMALSQDPTAAIGKNAMQHKNTAFRNGASSQLQLNQRSSQGQQIEYSLSQHLKGKNPTPLRQRNEHQAPLSSSKQSNRTIMVSHAATAGGGPTLQKKNQSSSSFQLRQQRSAGTTSEVVSPSKPSFMVQKQKFSSGASSNYNSKRKTTAMDHQPHQLKNRRMQQQMLPSKSMSSGVQAVAQRSYNLPQNQRPLLFPAGSQTASSGAVEEFSDIVVQETLEADRPSFKGAELRRSLTASQGDRMKHAKSRPSLNMSERKSIEGKVADFSGHHPEVAQQMVDDKNGSFGDYLDEKFQMLQIPEHGLNDPHHRISAQKKQTANQTINMLKLYQNSRQKDTTTTPKMSQKPFQRQHHQPPVDTSDESVTIDMTEQNNNRGVEIASNVLLTNEENLLEQTLGQTLTQQKQVLDQINSQSRYRNHMQLMNKYLVSSDNSFNNDNLGGAGSKLLTQQHSSTTQGTVQAGAAKMQQLGYERGPPIVFNYKQIRGEAIMMDEGISRTVASGITTKAMNSPSRNVDQMNGRSSVSLRQDGHQVQVGDKPRAAQTQVTSKVNTAQMSPVSRRPMKITLPSSSNCDSADDEVDMVTERNEKPTVPVSLAQRFREQPSQTSLGGVHVRSRATTPGQALTSLKDRRSMSRLDGMARSLHQPDHLQQPQNNSTSKKLLGSRPKISRDLSMPRLAPSLLPTDDLGAASPLGRKQKQLGSRTPKGPISELNCRLQNLTNLHGPSFLTVPYRNIKSIDIRNNRVNELPDEICSLQNLTQMKLDYNYLQALPFSLGSLKSLVSISASQNRLLQLPDSLFHKESQLHTLLVNDNKISVVQKGLGKLVHLKTLFLHNNLIVEIPLSLSQLTKLTEFSLDWLLYIEEKKSVMTTFDPDHITNDKQGRPSERQTIVSPANQDIKITPTVIGGANTKKVGSISVGDSRKITQQEIVTAPPQGNRKVLKGERGHTFIKEIKLMLKYQDQSQRNVSSDYTSGHHLLHQYKSGTSSAQEQSSGTNGYAHFLQFLMYFNQVTSLGQVRDLTYNHKSRTLIHQIALNGHLYLLKGAISVLGISRASTSLNINAADDDNSTALLLAMKQKRFDLVKYLLRLPQTKTDVYSIKYGLPLHVALAQTEFKLAGKLIKSYFTEGTRQTDSPFEVDVNVANEYGNTPLHLVFLNFSKDPEMGTVLARLLIRSGADLKSKNQHGLGLLHLAVQSNNMIALKFALTHNQQLKAKKKMAVIDDQLFDFNDKSRKLEWTVLHYAIYHTNLAMITFLLSCGEKIDLTAIDTQGKRAIDLCPYSSPIFKSIRDQIRRITKKQALEALHQSPVLPMGLQFSNDEKYPLGFPRHHYMKSEQESHQVGAINHQLLSTRECSIQANSKRSIQKMHQLQMLKQLPAEQFMQDVPPGPGPFPQKTILQDYNSIPITETGGTVYATAAFRDGSFVDESHLKERSEFEMPHIAIPEALNQTNDVAMNVPTSFDHRQEDSRGDLRKSANKLHYGVTNPVNLAEQRLDYEETCGQIRISSIKDEENLNAHMSELMLMGGDYEDDKDDGQKTARLDSYSPFLVNLTGGVRGPAGSKLRQQEEKKDLLESDSVNSDTLRLLHSSRGDQAVNPMIYSTLTAAFPYALKAASPQKNGQTTGKGGIHAAMVTAGPMPTLIETGNLLDLSRQNTDIKMELAEINNGKSEYDSADNMDDIDEKEGPGAITPTSGLNQVVEQSDLSDGENVDADDEDSMSKAFQARESQWNRKMSTKHPEEKKLQLHKIRLMNEIVKSFEEARNYYQNPINGENRQTPRASPTRMIAPKIKKISLESISEKMLKQTIKLESTLDKRAEKTLKNGDMAERILCNDQEELNKPLRSNKFSNNHFKMAGDVSSPTKMQIVANSTQNSGTAQTKQKSTHNINFMMSTVKVTDLKLHLNQLNAESIGAADSHRVFGPGDHGDSVLDELAQNVYIHENDSNVLLWANSKNSLKLKSCITNLMKFVELLAVSRLGGAAASDCEDDKYPTQTHLVFNLHELENQYLLKVNEASQKQSMKLIIINSTGRHRKAPSDFQSAKTIKRQELGVQVNESLVPSMSQTKRLVGGGRQPIETGGILLSSTDKQFTKQEQKDYREEDSMMMYDSNVPSSAVRLEKKIIDLQQQARGQQSLEWTEEVYGGALKQQQPQMFQSKSTSQLGGVATIRPSSRLKSLIKDSSTSGTVRNSMTSGQNRRHPFIQSSARVSSPQKLKTGLSRESAAFIDKHNLRYSMEVRQRKKSVQRSPERSIANEKHRNSSRSIGKVGLEGQTQIALNSKNQSAVATQSFNMASHKDRNGLVLSSMMLPKKGVTTGMQLVKPEQKSDQFNLDLTMQIDANEELKVNEEGSIANKLADPLMASSDINFLDGTMSSPNKKIEKQIPIQSRMIGEIQQFNKLMHAANKDSFSKRLSGRQTGNQSRGIGMHARQQDPLGSIALTHSDSGSKHVQTSGHEQQSLDSFKGDTKLFFN